MIERVIGLGLPFAWFTADEACGDNGRLRDLGSGAGADQAVFV
ncbi:MAG TPA: hypothetical protein VN840_03590 [Streptosporangiaceae bacterium]|nr:hypothetical protein [Streptosporangiaceae bacterium]